MNTVGLINIDKTIAAVMINNTVIQATHRQGSNDVVLLPLDMTAINYTAEKIANSLATRLQVFELDSKDIGKDWTWEVVADKVSSWIDLAGITDDQEDARCMM